MIQPKFIGHVHLKVSDLERAQEFYTRALGSKVTEQAGRAAYPAVVWKPWRHATRETAAGS